MKATKNDKHQLAENLKLSHKAQKSGLVEALDAERTQMGSFNRLSQLNRDFKCFKPSAFQMAIAENIREYFPCMVKLYNKRQKLKAQQVDILRNAGYKATTKGLSSAVDDNLKELLYTSTFTVFRTIEATKTLDEQTEPLKSGFTDEKSAKEYINAHRLNDRKGITFSIVENVRPVSVKFSPAEALKLAQKAEKKFLSAYPTAEAVTLQMLETALSMKVTKVKKGNPTAKVELKIAS